MLRRPALRKVALSGMTRSRDDGGVRSSPLLVACPAEGRYRLGIGEQRPEMFADQAWQDLRLRQVRYVVPWDWQRAGRQADVDAFMTAARARRQDVLVAFTAPPRATTAFATPAHAPAARRAHAPTARRCARSTTPTRGSARTRPGTRSTTSRSRPSDARGSPSATTPCCGARRAYATSASWPPTCSTPRTCAPTCGRSSAVRPAVRACGGCTTTRTSTAGPQPTRARCCASSPAASG